MSRDDRLWCAWYPVVFSFLVLLCLAAVWAFRLVTVVAKGTLDGSLLWLVLLGLFLVWQSFVLGGVLKSMLRAYSEEKRAAMSLLAEYLGGEMPEWVTCAYKHPAFAHETYPRLESQWKNLCELVRCDLDRYDPRKNIPIGLILLGDEALGELPVGRIHESSRADEQGSAHALAVKGLARAWLLDSLMAAHLGADLQELYPKEVYYLRLNLLSDYVSCRDSGMYDNENTDDWYLRYGYDLPEELPILHLCRHILQHDGDPPVEFDENAVRRRFAEVHEEYFPTGIQKAGGSWLRPKPSRNAPPFFAFIPLTGWQEDLLERIMKHPRVEWGGHNATVSVSASLLGETNEEVNRTLKAVWRFYRGSLPEHGVSYGVTHVRIPADVAFDWEECKRIRALIWCPQCHKLGLMEKAEDRVWCPHCQYEFLREKEQEEQDQGEWQADELGI